MIPDVVLAFFDDVSASQHPLMILIAGQVVVGLFYCNAINSMSGYAMLNLPMALSQPSSTCSRLLAHSQYGNLGAAMATSTTLIVWQHIVKPNGC